MFCAVVILELPDNSTGDQVMMAVESSPTVCPLVDDEMEDNDDVVKQ